MNNPTLTQKTKALSPVRAAGAERWPLMQSQALALGAVSQQMAQLQQEVQNRLGIIFQELSEVRGVDGSKFQGKLVEDADKKLFFEVTPISDG